MSNHKETVAEKLARMQRETGASGAADPNTNADLVDQLTHEDAGEPNLAAIAEKMKERRAAEAMPTFNERTEKMTIYIDADVAEAFNAMCVNRGDKQRYATQALREFTIKMAKEMGL